MRRALGWIWLQVVRIRTRLLVINLVAVLVPVVGIEWARTFERETLRILEQGMLHQAQVIRTVLEHSTDPQGRPNFALIARALEVSAKRTRMRIRLLDSAGRVVADSHLRGAPEGPEPTVSAWSGRGPPARRLHEPGAASTDPGPLARRREIRSARRGELGTATRVHRRIQRVFLFLALPVMHKRRVMGIVYVTRSTTPVLVSMHRLRRSLLQVLAVALSITCFVSLFLAATISRPLSRLTRAAERIARGDRRVSLRLSRRDEIGQLARAYDALVQQLDARAQYISEFAANISHEFKTPLTSIRGAAELLSDGADDDPKVRQRFLSNIQKDVARLDRLVSRILELSRIEATLEERADFDLAEAINEVSGQFADGEVTVQLPGAELPIHGNRPHLESALYALLENAVRFSPEGVAATIEAEAEGERLRVRVRDQGPGISKANQAKVFDRFFTTETAQGGTGLGLAIVAVVVKAHGGAVTLQSEPGEGCTFTLEVPAG